MCQSELTWTPHISKVQKCKQTVVTFDIGRASLARENEAGAVGGRGSIYSMLTYRTLFLAVIIELFRNSVGSVILSEGLLQAQAVEHFAGDNDHRNHEF